MIASWMLYALAISILVTIAAFGLERAGQARGYATRFVWAAALALSIGWPAMHVIARLMPETGAAVRVLPFTIVVQAPAAIVAASDSIGRAALVDRGLAALWIAASLLLFARLAAGVRTVERSRAQWKTRSVDGVGVRLSENVGPAVVGLRAMDVVLPEWILQLDTPLRAMVLRHEEEHRSARDPYLLFAAAVAVALMPWNVALWIQARRLRLAVEMDCDARVLRAHPTPERYGMLMLTIAQRRSVAPAMFAPMLSEPTTDLERRILAMRRTTKRLARWTMWGGGVIAAATLAFASTLQSATSLPTSRIPHAVAQAAKRVMPPVSTPAPRAQSDTPAAARIDAIRQPGNLAPRYPEALMRDGIEGSVTVRFVTDAAGLPDSSTIDVVSSTHELFTSAVLRVLPLWHLTPNATMVMPFAFVLAGGRTLAAIQAGGGQPLIVVDGVRTQSVLVVGNASTTTAPAAAPAAAPAPPRRPTGQPQRVTNGMNYKEFQVEKQAAPVPGNTGPRYPDALRDAGVEGEVLAQFVVDTTGRAVMSTFKVLKSTDTTFSNTVRVALADMRFYPAEVGGLKVKQVIEMPFQFNLSKR